MCGILGFYNPGEKADQILDKLVDVLHHRGPDGDGKFLKKGFALGHVRLSLVDLVAGAQPITYKHLTIVFNGEIYNHNQLRAQLIADGYEFTTASDTEVLLKLFDQKGPSCVDDLNGIFAFAILNTDTEEVYLARDFFGVKPLYFFSAGLDFAFASEWKTVFAYLKETNTPYEVNIDALIEYLRYGYPESQRLIKDIHSVPRGTMIRFNKGKQEVVYQMTSQKTAKTTMQHIEDVLTRQIELELDADVEVGILLSGGIDSSLITYLASKSNKEIKTFSVGYSEGKRYDESKYAELVAKKTGAQHHVFYFTEDDLLAELPELINCLDQPIYDPAMLPLLFLSKNVKKHVKAALSGDGGDELFGGYTHYRILKYRGLFSLVHKALKIIAPNNNKVKTVGNILNDIHKPKGPFMYRPNLLTQTAIQHASEEKSWRKTMQEEIDTTLQKKLLVKTDLSSMYYGLEIRVPFLNKKLYELSTALPAKNFINLLYGKVALRRLVKKYVNADIAYKPKKGFRVPLNNWIRTEKLGAHIDSSLRNDCVIPPSVISSENVNWLLDKKHDMELGNEIFSLYVLNEWLKKHKISLNESTAN